MFSSILLFCGRGKSSNKHPPQSWPQAATAVPELHPKRSGSREGAIISLQIWPGWIDQRRDHHPYRSRSAHAITASYIVNMHEVLGQHRDIVPSFDQACIADSLSQTSHCHNPCSRLGGFQQKARHATKRSIPDRRCCGSAGKQNRNAGARGLRL